jgi:hypothetical protein
VHTYAGDNHLLSIGRVLDGQRIYEFKRCGAFSRDRSWYLPVILHPWRLAALCRVGRFVLVYGHLGKGATASPDFSPRSKQIAL